MTLAGQHIVIIGGSSGMGLATARAAVDAGARVTIASSSRARLDAALATLPDASAGVIVDARRESDIADLFAGAGEIDHLVFTSGDAARPRPLAELSIAEARALLEVRLWGAITAVKYATPHLRPGGSTTLTSGTIGERPAPGTALVAGGSAAIEGLSRGFAVELAPIRVNAVRPGAILTPLWDSLPQPQRETALGALANRNLMKVIGTADQIAAAHLYLMENEFVTGTVLTVDGGQLLT